MSARDELAELVLPILEKCFDSDWKMTYSEMVTDAILADGYSKPRTITTVAEMDALPIGSVVLDLIGISLHKNPFTGWCASNGAKEIGREFWAEALPATVLYEASK